MKYEIRSPVATSVVELIRVAAAMASAEAMLLVDAKSGETVLHRSTYEGRFNDSIDLLLTEAYKGRLRVCNNDGRECTMDALVSERLGITCQALSYNSFQRVATVVFTRQDWLTEWRHDEFVVQQVPSAAWCKQGFVGEGILGAPVRTGTPPAFEHEPATAEAAPAGLVLVASQLGAHTPRPLTTPEVAEAFDGIDGQTAKQWRSKLGDVNNHQWLLPARAARVSPKPATWWPLKFADLLLKRARRAPRV